jgi:hypothetical protein
MAAARPGTFWYFDHSSARYSHGEIVRRMLRFVSSGFDMTNGIYYLSNFSTWLL